MAGVAWFLSRAQREIGLESDCVVFPSTFGYPFDEEYVPRYDNMHYSLPSTKKKLPKAMFFIARLTAKYQVVHFHWSSFLLGRLDLPFIKMMGKKIIMHYHGSDIRGKVPPRGDRFADHTIVSTPDLLSYVPYAVWIPNPVPDHGLRRRKSDPNQLVVGHAPSDRTKKGTTFILPIFRLISQTYPNVKLKIVENVSHETALSAYREFDILIDTILATCGSQKRGWYGVVANEVQHMGIPVVTTIREDLLEYLPEKSGIVSADATNLAEVLSTLIEDEESRRDLGAQGARFVRKCHDPVRCARIVSRLYDS
jgi:hypothetical protein